MTAAAGRGPRSWAVLAGCVVAVVAVGAAAGWVGASTGGGAGRTGASTATDASACDAADVAERVLPSVVTIEVGGDGAGARAAAR
ncbi:hypothetical protein P9139_16005 [Curtobacterium flaccumfaciens]|nr:hypothetical protein P9139_16005 [Curtobacterium flaccumfaciens]